jgi:hypothetical protein
MHQFNRMTPVWSATNSVIFVFYFLPRSKLRLKPQQVEFRNYSRIRIDFPFLIYPGLKLKITTLNWIGLITTAILDPLFIFKFLKSRDNRNV